MVQHDVPDWNSITDGTKLYAGGYVYHAGHTWRCMASHIKTAQDAPSIESPVWLDMTDDLKGVYHEKDYRRRKRRTE